MSERPPQQPELDPSAEAQRLVGRRLRRRSNGDVWLVKEYDAEKNEFLLHHPEDEHITKVVPDARLFVNEVFLYGDWMIDTGKWN